MSNSFLGHPDKVIFGRVWPSHIDPNQLCPIPDIDFAAAPDRSLCRQVFVRYAERSLLSHSRRYTADRQATQRRRISRLRPTIRFYSFCYFCPKISLRLMSRTADACYRAQSENDKEATADAHPQRPLFQPFIRYQPALFSRPSRVKCPLPDITVACPAKRAQRAFASDSPCDGQFCHPREYQAISQACRRVDGFCRANADQEITGRGKRARPLRTYRQGDAPEGRSSINAATENPVEHDGEGQRSGN